MEPVPGSVYPTLKEEAVLPGVGDSEKLSVMQIIWGHMPRSVPEPNMCAVYGSPEDTAVHLAECL